jgi:hypothetical protein
MESKLDPSICQPEVVKFIKEKGVTIPSLVKKDGLPFYVNSLYNEKGELNYPISQRGTVYANVRFLSKKSYEYRCPVLTKENGKEQINKVWVQVIDPTESPADNIPEWRGGRTRRRLKKRRATRRAKKRTRRSKS